MLLKLLFAFLLILQGNAEDNVFVVLDVKYDLDLRHVLNRAKSQLNEYPSLVDATVWNATRTVKPTQNGWLYKIIFDTVQVDDWITSEEVNCIDGLEGCYLGPNMKKETKFYDCSVQIWSNPTKVIDKNCIPKPKTD